MGIHNKNALKLLAKNMLTYYMSDLFNAPPSGQSFPFGQNLC